MIRIRSRCGDGDGDGNLKIVVIGCEVFIAVPNHLPNLLLGIWVGSSVGE